MTKAGNERVPPAPPPASSPQPPPNQVLLSSVESMEASDAQVGSLRARLLDSVEQKREILGEVSSSTEIVRDGADGGAKKMSTGRAFKASKELSQKELVDAAAASSKSAAVGIAKVIKTKKRLRERKMKKKIKGKK